MNILPLEVLIFYKVTEKIFPKINSFLWRRCIQHNRKWAETSLSEKNINMIKGNNIIQ